MQSPKQLGLLWKLDPDGAGLRMREIGDPGDRRVKLLALTRKGTALRHQALDRLYKPPREFFDLDLADQELLNTILPRAVANRAQDIE